MWSAQLFIMDGHFSFQILTPSGIVYQDPGLQGLIAWGEEGELAVLPGHTTFLTPLRISELRAWRRGQRREEELVWALAGGILEVTKGKVLILSPAVESSGEIDKERADQARQRARLRLEKKEKGIDLERAQRALDRAEVRLKVAAYGESQPEI